MTPSAGDGADVGDVSGESEALDALSHAIGDAKFRRFLTMLAEQLQALSRRLEAPDTPTEDLAREAHAVRGFAGTLGFVALSDSLAVLEEACGAGASAFPARAQAARVAARNLQTIERRLSA